MPRYSQRGYGRRVPLPERRLGSTDLHAGESLRRGQQVSSNNRQYTLVFQTDGNVVIYAGNAVRWATNTAGSAAQTLIMQTDGNLVLYDASNRAIWASNTAGNQGAFAVLQDDGNFVVYLGQSPLWSARAAELAAL
jgi:hypothetical protein